MLYAFGDFTLDLDRAELRANGEPVAVEPQVFALLRYLVEHRERLVSRDDLIAGVWSGRIVSESAISSRIKSARQALGDDGRAQRFIKTVHGMGFRFVADVHEATPAAAAVQPPPGHDRSAAPSLAVLPFRLVGVADPAIPLADALPHDLITGLSRLHWLTVIARGSSFRYRGRDASLDRVRQELGVRYVLTGVIEVSGSDTGISVELSDAADARILWSERFDAPAGGVHEVREEIVRSVINSLELRIPLDEALRAQLKSPESLDVWGLYHLGLRHAFRFTEADNARAIECFRRAVDREPGFARAHGGLSFACFQSGFLGYAGAEDASGLARRHAAQCLDLDPLDPFGHFTMGRSLWLSGEMERSLPWLERANELNPNFAQARYSRGWTEAMMGLATRSDDNVDAAIALSPLDPLLYGMLGVRAFNRMALRDDAGAAQWAERAASAPGAHALIEMIAAAAHMLNGDAVRAAYWTDRVRERGPHLGRADFFRAFPFRNEQARTRMSGALERCGF